MQIYNIPIKIKVWKDKDTKLWMAYSNKYQISAYGRTKPQALVMFKISVLDILERTKPKAHKRKTPSL